jgi:glutamate synthase (NADPH/NADH) large chain
MPAVSASSSTSRTARATSLSAKAYKFSANLSHRGAVGADPLAGDGAGILLQIPDAFLRAECAGLGIDLPQPGDYAVGMVFLPRDPGTRAESDRRSASVHHR